MRMRKLIRSGWILVEINADQSQYQTEWSNPFAHFNKMTNWCRDNIMLGEWQSKIHADRNKNFQMYRFVFKEEKFASWFKLLHVK